MWKIWSYLYIFKKYILVATLGFAIYIFILSEFTFKQHSMNSYVALEFYNNILPIPPSHCFCSCYTFYLTYDINSLYAETIFALIDKFPLKN